MNHSSSYEDKVEGLLDENEQKVFSDILSIEKRITEIVKIINEKEIPFIPIQRLVEDVQVNQYLALKNTKHIINIFIVSRASLKKA